MAMHVSVYQARQDRVACSVDGDVCWGKRGWVAEVEREDCGWRCGEEDAAGGGEEGGAGEDAG